MCSTPKVQIEGKRGRKSTLKGKEGKRKGSLDVNVLRNGKEKSRRGGEKERKEKR